MRGWLAVERGGGGVGSLYLYMQPFCSWRDEKPLATQNWLGSVNGTANQGGTRSALSSPPCTTPTNTNIMASLLSARCNGLGVRVQSARSCPAFVSNLRPQLARRDAVAARATTDSKSRWLAAGMASKGVPWSAARDAVAAAFCACLLEDEGQPSCRSHSPADTHHQCAYTLC